jgi:hypothetical protein
MAKKKGIFKATKEMRAIARERVGTVKASKVIPPRSSRKPRYPEDPMRSREDFQD